VEARACDRTPRTTKPAPRLKLKSVFLIKKTCILLQKHQLDLVVVVVKGVGDGDRSL